MAGYYVVADWNGSKLHPRRLATVHSLERARERKAELAKEHPYLAQTGQLRILKIFPWARSKKWLLASDVQMTMEEK